MTKLNNKAYSFLWTLATIFEWANVVLFMAAMGFEFNIPIYRNIEAYPHIAKVYYLSAAIDIALFAIVTLIARAKKDTKNTLVALYCFIIQVALLIYKVKL